jgi:hypothetical protein
MVFSFIFGTMGFLGLGISLHRQMFWLVPFTFELLIFFGLQFVNISTYGYISDCLRDHTAEAFASLTITSLYEFGLDAIPYSAHRRNELRYNQLASKPRTAAGIHYHGNDARRSHAFGNSCIHLREAVAELDC